MTFEDKLRLAGVQKRGMTHDVSWQKAAGAYERLYQESM